MGGLTGWAGSILAAELWGWTVTRDSVSAVQPDALRDGSKALQSMRFFSFFDVIRYCFLLLPLILAFFLLQ